MSSASAGGAGGAGAAATGAAAGVTVRRLEGTNEPHIAGLATATALVGARVALVVSDDGAAGSPLRALTELLLAHPAAAAALVADLELMLGAFDACVGKRPPVARGLDGRVRVEIDFLQGAAGLAHHGVAGFAVGPAFAAECVRARAAAAPATRRQLSHVFMYECTRNYIFPEEFTPLFDYCVCSGAVAARGTVGAPAPACWGWQVHTFLPHHKRPHPNPSPSLFPHRVNQGFVNVLGVLLVSDAEPAIAIDYHGSDGPAFLASMEAQLDRHVAGVAAGELCWSDTFMHERLPWAAHQSLDNAYSGLLVRLWRRHGRGDFVQRFFSTAMPLLRTNGRVPAGKTDVAAARENLLVACSVAARTDLCDFFERSLGMPLRTGTRDDVAACVLAAS